MQLSTACSGSCVETSAGRSFGFPQTQITEGSEDAELCAGPTLFSANSSSPIRGGVGRCGGVWGALEALALESPAFPSQLQILFLNSQAPLGLLLLLLRFIVH